MADELHSALSKITLRCDSIDHRKGEYHEIGEPCPALAKVIAAKEKYESMLKNVNS